MQPEELLRTTRARAREVPPPQGTREAAIERLRTACAVFFALVPEPPVYLRREDPLREQAAVLRDNGAEILVNGLAFLREAGEDREVRELLEALESHLGVLCHLADARLEAAELAWEDARARERHALSARRKWKRSDAQKLPVFDAATGISRFDPRDAPQLDVRMCCPHCRMPDQYRFAATRSEQRMICPKCKAGFLGFFGELRSARSRVDDGRRTYSVEFEELAGPVSRVEFDDAGATELSLTRGDLIVLTYSLEHSLRCVQNLSTGRLLWISRGGPCFVVTVAFGADAPELEAFRRFRDQVLLRSAAGRLAVRTYYARGPALARFVEAHPRVRRHVRRGLSRIHRQLERERAP